MKDEQSLFVNSRIILTNTGRLPLTHILVDFGNKSESIIEILPGQKFPVSPPERYSTAHCNGDCRSWDQYHKGIPATN